MSTVTRYEIRERAAWITLDSPANRNALSAPLVAELGAHLRAAFSDDAVRAIVLTGAGPAFCAGADLKNRGDAVAAGGGPNPFVEILRLMWDGPKPVVVAVNGHVEGATFSFSEVRVGVIPAMISVVVLPKIGANAAMRLFLTGARFDAREAAGYGLVHRVVPADGLVAAAEEQVRTLALGGPIAVAEAKRLIRTVSRLPMDEAFAYAEAKIAALFASEEAAEGMMAFAQKRKPRWAE